MTRFARAKGSKGSNEKRAEEATSWGEMKKQILETEERKKVKENINSSFPSTSHALEEKEEKSEWAAFEEPSKVSKGITKKKKKLSLERKKKMKALARLAKDTFEVPVKSKKFKSKGLDISNTEEQMVDNAPENADENESNKIIKQKKEDKQIKQSSKNGMGKDDQNTDKNELKANTKKKRNELKLSQQQSIDVEENHASANPMNQKKKDKKIKQGNRNVFEPQRRKPDTGPFIIYVEGRQIEVDKFDGFPVQREDATRLKKLKKDMESKGIPKQEMQAALKVERRRAEKALARLRRKVCFQCRKSGHMLSECPEVGQASSNSLLDEGTVHGVCFTCGSTEHSYTECKVARKDDFRFAKCFVCGEQGHIARQCTDNPCGLYPRGGACRLCGDVTHLRRDCPMGVQEKQQNTITLPTLGDTSALEALDTETSINKDAEKIRKPEKKLVKF